MQDIIESCKFYQRDTFIDHVWNFDHACELEPFQLVCVSTLHNRRTSLGWTFNLFWTCAYTVVVCARMLERVYKIVEASEPALQANAAAEANSEDGEEDEEEDEDA